MKKGFWELFRETKAKAAELEEEEKRKARTLSHDMDFQYLEELVQKVNENPELRIRITLKDGTVLDVDARPRKKQLYNDMSTDSADVLEVR